MSISFLFALSTCHPFSWARPRGPAGRGRPPSGGFPAHTRRPILLPTAWPGRPEELKLEAEEQGARDDWREKLSKLDRQDRLRLAKKLLEAGISAAAISSILRLKGSDLHLVILGLAFSRRILSM